MIRPFTFLCFLLACASGLYLYQSKHRVEMLDHQIEQTVHATDQLREQTRVLHAEWTLLNDPQRLQALADQFLNLKPVAPGQFTSVAELDNRLPAVKAPEPVPAEPTGVPVAQAPETMQQDAPQPAPVADAMPKPVSVVATAAIPSKPANVSAAAPTARIAEPRLPPARQQLAEVAPPRPAPPVRRPMVAMELPRPAPTRIIAAAMPAPLPSAPFTGSALGMAHIGAAPPPRPMPVSTQQWASGGGGGG